MDVTPPGKSVQIEDRLILDAAQRLFETLGPKRVTMADVARHAGVSRATLYRRWPNMTAILNEFVNNEFLRIGMQTIEVDTELHGAGPLTRQRIVDAILRVVTTMRKNALLHTIIRYDPEYLVPDPIDRPGWTAPAFLSMLREALAAGAAEGSVRADGHEMLAASILLTCYSFVLTGPVMVDDVTGLDATLRDLLDRLLRP